MPDEQAARVTDMHACPMADGPKPHVGGPIKPPCEPTVTTGSLAQARISDMALCAGPPDVIAQGASTVTVRGLFASRRLDTTVHGGKIMIGWPTVLIGGPVFTARPVTKSGKDFKYGSAITVEPDPNDPDYQSKVIASLIRIDSTPTGKKLFDALEGSGHTVTIVPYNSTKDPFNATTTPTGLTGHNSTIAWNPAVNGFGPPGTTPAWAQPGSDTILAHEMVHAAHNATGTNDPSVINGQGVQVNEERNTTGLPAQTYTGGPGDPLNGTALPNTQTGSPYNENALRDDYRDRGIPSPVTGVPPEPRPSYYPAPSGPGGAPAAPGTAGTPF